MKISKKSPWMQGSLIGLGAAFAASLLFAAGTLQWLELRTWDWRVQTLAAPGKATSQICTIMIDQSSLDDAEDLFGFSWIWPRQVYSYILDFCERAGAKAVVFDLVFTESSNHGVSDDESFGEAISRGVPFVAALPMGQMLGTATQWMDATINNLPLADHIPGMSTQMLLQTTMPRTSFPIPEVATNAAIMGNVVSQPDADAVYRRAPPFRVFDNRFIPNLGLAAYFAAHTNASISVTPHTVTIDGRCIPLDRQGNAILRFRGRSQTHRAFNAAAILQSELRIQEGGTPPIDPLLLKDMYVVLGVTAPGLMDLKPTPVGETYPGLEVNATFLDNFLSNDFARITPLPATLIAMLMLGLLAGITVRIHRHVAFSIIAFPLFTAIPFAAGFAAYPFGLWLPVAPLAITGLLAMIAAVITNYAVEGRQKRFIKGAFMQFLSHAVIEKLMEDPDRLALGGEEKVLSIYFSDVQGFTSIAEKLTPTELTSLLNEYLTAMTDIIHQTGGTIDKYEGDAIIAFWNAPLDQEDHAMHAVRAALMCQAKLADIRPDLKQRYKSDLTVRIGINTGLVVVGNMGSNQRFDYTFLGDAGNLAARLEGINKQFGTYLLISENTRKAIGTEFPVREISRVRVVGKSIPITIFEPMLPEKAQSHQSELLTFHTALQHYYEGRFDNAKTLFDSISDKDPVSSIYAKRCAILQQSPPPDWDGIWNITEK